MQTDSGWIAAVGALLLGALGAPAVLKLIDLWGSRRRAEVDADLTLAGGWRDLAEKLSTRVTALEAEIERLRAEVARLQVENAGLHAENAVLGQRVETLMTRVVELEGHGPSA